MMRIAVGIAHAMPSPNKGDICHLGAEIEPIPEAASWLPLCGRFLPPRCSFGYGPLLAPIIAPFGKNLRPFCGGGIQVSGRNPKGISLETTPVAATTFVILSSIRRYREWQPPQHPKFRPALQLRPPPSTSLPTQLPR